MATLSIIQLKELQRFNRIDSEYYQPKNVENYEKLKKIGSIRLGDPNYAKITDGIHASIDYDPKSEINCISAMSPRLGYFDLTGNKYISESQHAKNPKTDLREGDVILSSVGTIGNCAVATKEILPANADRHVGIIRTKHDKLDPHYVCAFLNSKYGRFQTLREATGNIQLNLFIDKMKELIILLIPPSEQKKIGQLVRESADKYAQSEQKFRQAIDALLDFTHFSSERLGHVLTYTVNFKTAMTEKRIDAEYYQPKYDNLLDDITKFKNGYLPLVEIASPSARKIQPQKKPDDNFTYVELASINGSIGIIDECSVILGRNAPTRARMYLQRGDVVASSVSGSFDKVALISEQFHESVGSTGFIVFRPKNNSSEYLLTLVKSPIVQLQLQKFTTGSILSSVSRPLIKKIIVPNVSYAKQEDIAKIVRESRRLFVESRRQMSHAIEKIEHIVEN